MTLEIEAVQSCVVYLSGELKSFIWVLRSFQAKGS